MIYYHEIDNVTFIFMCNSFTDGGDLMKTITKIFDEKKKALVTSSRLLPDSETVDILSKDIKADFQANDKENIPSSPKLYRNPSLHKNHYRTLKLTLKEDKGGVEKEKDEDSSMSHDENVPDNERHISSQGNIPLNATHNIHIDLTLIPSNNNNKLTRSESLNKPDRTVSPSNVKLKRSESLNKAGDKLKRSDSLTKTEKTESNISKRRELSGLSRRTNKDLIKLKRKSGTQTKSIKRRHTVGGTKDPDKVTWLDNRENVSIKENVKEKCPTRTSSPDLSSTRRERFHLQVNLIASGDMVHALREHLIGVRPQSFPNTKVYKVPLESHV